MFSAPARLTRDGCLCCQPDHPDPRGENLRLIARVLKHYINAKGGKFAVFLDFMSLHQKPRSTAGDELFGIALNGLSDWYCHPATNVFKITQLPSDYPDAFTFPMGTTPNIAGYVDRGWCFMESSVANMVKDGELVLNISGFTGKTDYMSWEGPAHECVQGRDAPLSPDAFWQKLQTKSFTSKNADLPTVKSLYETAFNEQMKNVVKLDFALMGWDDEQMHTLCATITFAHANGALDKLEKLFLSTNAIGDEGMSALAKAITPDKDGKGALAPGATVYLGANNATETGKQAMQEAAKARGLSVYV